MTSPEQSRFHRAKNLLRVTGVAVALIAPGVTAKGVYDIHTAHNDFATGKHQAELAIQQNIYSDPSRGASEYSNTIHDLQVIHDEALEDAQMRTKIGAIMTLGEFMVLTGYYGAIIFKEKEPLPQNSNNNLSKIIPPMGS